MISFSKVQKKIDDLRLTGTFTWLVIGLDVPPNILGTRKYSGEGNH